MSWFEYVFISVLIIMLPVLNVLLLCTVRTFYKIDKSRADSKSSVGLGLSIASDIIRSHGGNIKLEKSSMNGLGVKIFLPV